MDLHCFLIELPEADRAEFANKCETTQNYLFKLARNFKRGSRPQPRLASLMERHSNQKVRRWELNPEDWHVTWPELVGLEGAPALPPLVGVPTALAEQEA